MPKKQVSAIWVVFGRNRIQPKGGKVIQISEEELQKLHFISKEQPPSSKRQKCYNSQLN